MASRRWRRPYADRTAAGAALAPELSAYAGRDDLVVLGLPRGGVPVAAVLAQRLAAPLDVLVVRKLGLPHRPEVAMGAIASVAGSLETVRNHDVLERAHVTDAEYDRALAAELVELHHREGLYRRNRQHLPLAGRVVLVIDDGLATGATMRVAAHAVRRQEPARIVLVAPVGPPDVCAALAGEADELICPWQPRDFTAVGAAYQVFDQTANEEVRRLLSASNQPDRPQP